MPDRPRVAVIGAGVLGLTALKNLLEEGFHATVFERQNYVGGLWHFTEDSTTTSASECTEWNSCSQMSCFTDFPFPVGTPDFPTLPQVQSYIESYCQHFLLYPHIKLRHNVKGISRTSDNAKWNLRFVDTNGVAHEDTFDKVIMAVGQTGTRLMPVGIGGLENFKGQIIHGQAFKRGSDFKHKRVLILGSSNTAMDCAVDLSGYAEKIYLSHRHGGVVIPRRYKNAPAEFSVNLRLQALGRMIGSIYPSAWANIFNNKCLEISKSAFGELPTEWRLNIPPNGQMCNPIINDRIVNLLQKGEVNIVQTMSRILPSGDVELIDGKIISDTDTIILCTGYTYDYSLIPESISPVRDINRKWQASQVSSNRPLHKLYRGLLSLDYPDSLAFLGVSGYPSSQMPLYDLISMAISQIWKGAYDLPSKEEMEAEVNERHAWLLELASKDSPSILPGRLKVGPWMEWLHDAAGTGVNERLGYGLSGWWYWITNFSSARKLMNGVNSPHIWRLFDGRRKKWDGAWEAIERVNQEARERQKGAIVKKTD